MIRKMIKGPDFPTGAYIYGRDGIKDYQETGRGKIVMRARAVIEEKETSNKSQIVVTELPYQVNRANLVRDIADLVRDKKLEGISDLRDESSDTTRIVIELKRDAIPRVVLNQLYKHTTMQATFGVIMLALVPDVQTRQLVPKVMGIMEVLQHYITHRHEVIVTSRAVRARQGARARAHPRRSQDRRRQHRRGDQGHSQGGGHAEGECPATEAVQALGAPGRSDPEHATREADGTRDRRARRGAEGSPRDHQGPPHAARLEAEAHEAHEGRALRRSSTRTAMRAAPRSRATRASSRSRI